jgi:hypothetical protein
VTTESAKGLSIEDPVVRAGFADRLVRFEEGQDRTSDRGFCGGSTQGCLGFREAFDNFFPCLVREGVMIHQARTHDIQPIRDLVGFLGSQLSLFLLEIGFFRNCLAPPLDRPG